MNRNPHNKHLKRINAPHRWMLDKMSGVWAPRPTPGPHKLRECLPIILMLRNRLKYALTAREVKMIVMSRHIRVDGKVRTSTKFPCGFQDVVTINRTAEHFRLIYDTKGRFALRRIPAEEANWKLLKVVKKALGARAIPYIVTHDGRTIPYPEAEIRVGDTLRFDFMKNKVMGIAHFQKNAVCMVTGGRNVGRAGTIEHVERHPGSFDIVRIKDSQGNAFATRRDNIFILGRGKSWIRLPKRNGIKATIIEDRTERLQRVKRQEAGREEPTEKKANDKQLFAGKATVLPPRVADLRKKTKEKMELLRRLRAEEQKSSKDQPKRGKKKKQKQKGAKGAEAPAAGGAAPAEEKAAQ